MLSVSKVIVTVIFSFMILTVKDVCSGNDGQADKQPPSWLKVVFKYRDEDDCDHSCDDVSPCNHKVGGL